DVFQNYAHTPYVVAANKQDMEDAWSPDDLRIALRVRSDVKMLPCVATDKESVKRVLLELLYNIMETAPE
ncbi:MAG: GTP-binding protein, partial [Anaerolineae bacterium]